MVKRIRCVAIAVITLAIVFCSAEQVWKTDTPGQKILKAYIESTNQYLKDSGEKPINRVFEIYPAFAALGITETADAEAPEGVEITAELLDERINRLQLRVSDDPDRFSIIAACLIRALYGNNISAEDAMKVPAELAAKAKTAPNNSYEEPVEELSGRIPRMYYAYYPDQYHDGMNWLQMTIIFPMEASWAGSDMIIGTPEERGIDPESGVSEDYEGYFSEDDYTHYEVFMTATPEPDSAATEYDFR